MHKGKDSREQKNMESSRNNQKDVQVSPTLHCETPVSLSTNSTRSSVRETTYDFQAKDIPIPLSTVYQSEAPDHEQEPENGDDDSDNEAYDSGPIRFVRDHSNGYQGPAQKDYPHGDPTDQDPSIAGAQRERREHCSDARTGAGLP